MCVCVCVCVCLSILQQLQANQNQGPELFYKKYVPPPFLFSRSSSPLVQFNLLHSKFHLCSVPTRALLLSAYIKFINLFPETKATIQEVLRSDSQIRNSDVELQQRAVEYLKLSSIASTDVLVSALASSSSSFRTPYTTRLKRSSHSA